MDFLADLVKRLFSGTPMFFTIVKWVLAIVALVTGLPELIADAGIDLPPAVDAIASKVVAIATAVGAFVAQLTVKDDTKKDLRLG